MDGVQQTAAAEGFGKEFDGAGFHRADRHGDVAVRGNENDRDVNPRLGQFVLEIHATQAWHAHIEYEASGSFGPMTGQELSGGVESLHFEPCRAKQAFGRATNRGIIVHYEYNSVGLGHVSSKVLQWSLRGKANCKRTGARGPQS